MNQDPDIAFDSVNGETLLEASFRVRAGMTRIVKICIGEDLQNIAVIAHGEIICQLMRYTLISDESFQNFLMYPNGMRFQVTVDPEKWFEDQKMQFVDYFLEGAQG